MDSFFQGLPIIPLWNILLRLSLNDVRTLLGLHQIGIRVSSIMKNDQFKHQYCKIHYKSILASSQSPIFFSRWYMIWDYVKESELTRFFISRHLIAFSHLNDNIAFNRFVMMLFRDDFIKNREVVFNAALARWSLITDVLDIIHTMELTQKEIYMLLDSMANDFANIIVKRYPEYTMTFIRIIHERYRDVIDFDLLNDMSYFINCESIATFTFKSDDEEYTFTKRKRKRI